MNYISIRSIKKEDIPFCLNLFNDETFGATGTFSNQKSNTKEELEALRKIVLHKTKDAKILIMEEANQQIGYALITRPSKNLFHISQFIINEENRNKGYGTILLNYIKSAAKKENCDISLQCLTSSKSFFEKNDFLSTTFSKYVLPLEMNREKPLATNLFNYNSIIKDIEKENLIEISNYQDFLQSNDYKRLTKMLEKR